MSHEQEIIDFIKAADAMIAAAEHFEGITGDHMCIVDGLVDNISDAKDMLLDNMLKCGAPQVWNARDMIDEKYDEIEKSVRKPENRVKEVVS